MKKPIYFLGDLHGSFNYLKWYIKSNKLKDCVIYQVGDFGIGFTTEHNDMGILGDLNDFLKERNIQLYCIRGNHDNPYFFDGHLANHFENLHLLADYTLIDIEGTKILGVGGAISIDRKLRLREMQEAARKGREVHYYWRDEIFVLDKEKIKTFENVEVVVTHTAPDFCKPTNKLGFGYLVEEFIEDDNELAQDLREERNFLTEMWNLLKEKNPNIKYHLYGHFHKDDKEIINDVEHICLGINKFYDLRLDYIDELNKKYSK